MPNLSLHDALPIFLFFFCWLLFNTLFYTFSAHKIAPFCLISKSHWKRYSLYTVWVILLVREIFFLSCSVFDSFIWASPHSIIPRILSPKNRTFLPYFKKSLNKVQSIHCLDDPFGARNFFLFFALFLIIFYGLLFIASFHEF